MEFSNRKNYDELQRHKFFAATNNGERGGWKYGWKLSSACLARSFGIEVMPAAAKSENF